MIWRRLHATFGKLEGRSLELGEGLNLIHAPNESGKSTWCAFLRVMLYGFPSRSRGALADKNRFAPWSGAAMEGSIDLEEGGRQITILRRTARANSPMGAFSALYTGTTAPVEGLTASNCGEELLGIPREVFERSAFIRQAGLAIDQDAELERRIAALITTGEEDTSFSATYERLKKQLTSRRYNRTGQLPQLEGEIARLEAALRQAQALQQQAASQEAALPELEAREGRLTQSWESAMAAKAQLEAQRAQTEAREAYARARSDLERQRSQASRLAARAAALPSRERLIELKAAAGNLTVSEVSRRQLAEQLRQRRQAAASARQALEPYGVFQGRSGAEALAQAQRDADAWEGLRRSAKNWPLFAAGAAICLGLFLLSLLVWHSAPAGILTAAGAAACLAGVLLCRKGLTRADSLAALYGAQQAEDFTAMARAYTALCENWDACRQEAEVTARRLEDLSHNMEQARARLLSEVHPFAPGAEELPSVSEALDQALRELGELEEARSLLGRLEERCAALSAALPAEDGAAVPAACPDLQALHSQLEEARRQTAAARQALADCRGQLKSLGDVPDLQARLEEQASLHARRQAEYNAIALAMEALSQANTALQNRFSPALGEKAANIFTKLTAGKYNKVLLNRDLAASAQEAGAAAPREALLLSQGAADQLYLSVRLAICDMVLPREKAIPLVLDDALTSFDDSRCAAALDFLMELSRERQILLFTCQEREGNYLRQAYPGQFTDVTGAN